MSYDAWRLRAPEDEPGYWANQTPECGDYYQQDRCEGCHEVLMICGNCQLCDECHREAEAVDLDEARADSGLDEDYL